MLSSTLLMASSALLAHASPLDLSLPPLIPDIEGVTVPLYNIVPPLPVLQAPLPPVDSPSFTGSEIKPNKIGYFWTGAGDKKYKGKISLGCFKYISEIVEDQLF